MSTLMQRYTQYNERLKAKGIKLISFDCPSCAKAIECQAAPRGDTWDSMANCPHCDALFKHITEGKKSYGLLPPAMMA